MMLKCIQDLKVFQQKASPVGIKQILKQAYMLQTKYSPASDKFGQY